MDGLQQTPPPERAIIVTEDRPGDVHAGSSEVARLRQLIITEYEAAQRGLIGFAEGTSKHALIEARMNRAGTYGDRLATLIGEPEATRALCELYAETMG